MRVGYLLLDPGIEVFGIKGASVHVQEIVRALREGGHHVSVFCTRRGSHVPDDLGDLDVRHLPLPSVAGPAEREKEIAAAAARVAEAVTRDGFDLLLERYSLFSDAGAQARERFREAGVAVPLVLEVNSPLIDEQQTHRTLVDASAAEQATARQLDAATAVVCVSEPVAAWAAARCAAPGRIHVLPNGVNTDRIRPRRSPPSATSGPVTVGFAGTLKPWHGTDVLLRALARTTSDLRLEILGTGPELAQLVDLADELGIADRVRFLGAVAPADVPGILQGFDLAVAPYPAGPHYFSPLKVYEYLAAGLPVVASAIGTLPEVLEQGRLGELVPPGDVAALARRLDMLARDPARREAIGRRAREAAVTQHTWRARCEQLLGAVGTT
ncbi:MAG: glycosyltransferase family 4 protein [Tessaracoccus sp.]|uniref:glycosyltransferase family 4 protein n=1 Tax=Tessaracoccus sp. TaxID=1971211 RepID=UPI001EB6B73E|nr:glycosyltransferase family 4 protein [Tessaracoccus sp.]MBK7821892.1 glycosyltransferase family 4 protein [Tessaracoccus sp.]